MVDLAETIDAAPESARLRTGRIVELLGAQQVVVDVGGGELVDMPCLAVDPILGDVVQILQQGAVQVVLGRTAPLSGDSTLANPSFELDEPGVAPTSWTTVINAGGANVKTDTASGWGSVTGTKWLEINQSTPLLTDLYVFSEAIPVQAGELWTAAGWAMNSSLDPDGGQCEILLSWQADATTLYPAGIGDTRMQVLSFPPGGTPSWALLRQISGIGADVPVGATYMRVVLSMVLSGGVGSSCYWDAIVCRKLRGV